MQLLAQEDVWLSLQALDEAPPTASPSTRAKKHTVVEGTDNAFKWARWPTCCWSTVMPQQKRIGRSHPACELSTCGDWLAQVSPGAISICRNAGPAGLAVTA